MKKLFNFLMVLFVFTVAAFCQQKPELYQDMITTENLRLRTSKLDGNKIITVLNKGSRVKIIGIERKEETVDGITSAWVKVEVQHGAKDKDGKPVPYAVVGMCFAGYLTKAPAVSYVPDYGNGNGTIIGQTENDELIILKRKHEQAITLGELADDRNIYADTSKKEVLTQVPLEGKIQIQELWLVQTKSDGRHYVWLKVKYNGISGFYYCSESDPYKNNTWEILDKIKIKGKTWTVRKVSQSLAVFSNEDSVKIYDMPSQKAKVIAELPSSYKNGNGQTNIVTEAVTEEYEDSYSNRWVRITLDGKTGWVYGKYLSAERGGPTYLIPEDWIDFCNGDAP